MAPESRVSVVIPTFNRAELLASTLESLAAQAPAPRVIVVDDGSADDTPAVLERFAPEVIRNPAGGWGPSRARNAGLERVATELVAFVDSDDLVLPGGLAALERALDAAPHAGFACGDALVARRVDGAWRADGLIAPVRAELADPAASLYARNWVPSAAALVRTNVARAAGGYDTTRVFSEDHHLWLRLARDGGPAHTPALVAVHRRHAGNRHAAVTASADDDAIAAGFAGPRAERLGVQLCEQVIEAIKAADATRAIGLVTRLATEPAALRPAVRHWRRRRASRALALRIWGEREDVRAFLEPLA
jgi:glycosyltransferase involved in cell wall biosynthesis